MTQHVVKAIWDVIGWGFVAAVVVVAVAAARLIVRKSAGK